MTPEQYRKIRDGLDARPPLRQLVLFCNHWLPAVPFVCYPVLLVILNVQWFALLRVGSAAAPMSSPALCRWWPRRPKATRSPPATR